MFFFWGRSIWPKHLRLSSKITSPSYARTNAPHGSRPPERRNATPRYTRGPERVQVLNVANLKGKAWICSGLNAESLLDSANNLVKTFLFSASNPCKVHVLQITDLTEMRTGNYAHVRVFLVYLENLHVSSQICMTSAMFHVSSVANICCG